MDINRLKFDNNGLIPAIVQDCNSKKVLMMAYMNMESLKMSIENGETYFFSRSRRKLWHKGETSTNVQKIWSISYDCDCDALLINVDSKGPACHTGNVSCFYRFILDKNMGNSQENDCIDIMTNLYNRIKSRKDNPIEGSYTNYLFKKGINNILKKLGEESTEMIIASKEESKDEIIYEIADYIYHLMVLLVFKNIKLEEMFNELSKRYYNSEQFKKNHKKRKELDI